MVNKMHRFLLHTNYYNGQFKGRLVIICDQCNVRKSIRLHVLFKQKYGDPENLDFHEWTFPNQI